MGYPETTNSGQCTVMPCLLQAAYGLPHEFSAVARSMAAMPAARVLSAFAMLSTATEWA
jgi:hypothetical protein